MCFECDLNARALVLKLLHVKLDSKWKGLFFFIPGPGDTKTCGCSHCVFLQGMRVLVDARDKLGISWQSCENEKQGMLVMSWEGRVGASGVEPGEFQLYVMALSALWADAGIQEAYTRRSEFQLVSRLEASFSIFLISPPPFELSSLTNC